MKAQLLRPVAVLGLCIALFASGAAGADSITVALVPEPSGSADTFVLDLDPSAPAKRGTAKLTFNVQAIPAGVNIESVILRLVPSGTVAANQQVRIFANDQYTTSLGQLVVSPEKGGGGRPAESDGAGLVATLKNAKQTLDLYLRTESIRTSQAYHSGLAKRSADRPRLIVSWTDPAPAIARNGPQLRHRGDPSDTTPWKNDAPKGAVFSTLPREKVGINTIIAGPVFLGDEILLIAMPAVGSNAPAPLACVSQKPDTAALPRLYSIAWNGTKRWDCTLPPLTQQDKAWKYLHVDAQGRVLAFANDGQIRVFSEFGNAGPAKRDDRPVTGMLLSSRPVVSPGGMVTFLNDNGYVYSLSPAPGLNELWRTDTNVGKAPPPVISPRRGDGLVYVVAVKDKTSEGLGLFVLDAVRGEQRFPTTGKQMFPAGSALGGFNGFHPPFVVAGTEHDWVLLSGFGQAGGVLEGYSNFIAGSPDKWRNPMKGAISRCVAPPLADAKAEPVVYCIQDGQFVGVRASGASVCRSEGKPLQSTSNLVTDGDGNVYFWEEKQSKFYGYNSSCTQLFSQTLGGLPVKPAGMDVLELRVGPNGVLYGTSNTELFSIHVTRTDAPKALVSGTRYATRGAMTLPAGLAAPKDGPIMLEALGENLAVDNLQVPANADVTCSATKGISFGRGFAVEKGAVLRCGIDIADARPAP